MERVVFEKSSKSTHINSSLVDRLAILKFLAISLAAGSAFGIFVGLLLRGQLVGLLVKMILFALFVVLATFFIVIILWALRLLLRKSSIAWDLNAKGFTDYMSPLQLGLVPLTAIKGVSTRDILGVPCIVLHLKDGYIATSHVAQPGLLRDIYLFLCGDQLIMPQDWLKPPASARNVSEWLERQNALGQSRASAAPPPASSTARNGVTPPVPPPISPPSPKFLPHEQRVLDRVQQIRERVRREGLDTGFVQLYWDGIRQFPKWIRDQAHRVPRGVGGARFTENVALEEVEFVWHGQSFFVQMQRSGGVESVIQMYGPKAKGQEPRLLMALRVSIHIGMLEVLSLEAFRTGPWEESLQALIRAWRRLETPDLSGGETQISTGSGWDQTSIVQLKKNFDLDDEH